MFRETRSWGNFLFSLLDVVGLLKSLNASSLTWLLRRKLWASANCCITSATGWIPVSRCKSAFRTYQGQFVMMRKAYFENVVWYLCYFYRCSPRAGYHKSRQVWGLDYKKVVCCRQIILTFCLKANKVLRVWYQVLFFSFLCALSILTLCLKSYRGIWRCWNKGFLYHQDTSYNLQESAWL